jgi:hypothetical protein
MNWTKTAAASCMLTLLSPAGQSAEDLALIIPNSVYWFIDIGKNGVMDDGTQWGLPGDRCVAGEPFAEYRNGHDEVMVTRPGAGISLEWWIKENDLRPGYSGRLAVRNFGLKVGRPLIMDVDGDGQQEAVVYERTAPHQVFLGWLRIDRDANLAYTLPQDSFVYWYVPVDEEDGLLAGRFAATVNFDEVAVWRKATGNWELYVSVAGVPTVNRFATAQFGLPGDLPLVSDFNEDGIDDLAVFRPGDNQLYVNYFEFGDPNAGFKDGDVDLTLDYDAQITLTNNALGQPGALWNLGAVPLEYAHEGSFQDLGYGLSGSQGVPQLSAQGVLLAGSDLQFALTNAAPSSPALLIVGFSEWLLPFAGGTLVPALDLVLPFLTDASGDLLLTGTLAPGVSGPLAFAVQAWVVDSAGPQGLAASNALRATLP